MQARAIKGLYLGPTKNAQGGHKIYNLETKAVITRKYVTEIPATLAIIMGINAIAKSEGMTNIIITSKTGELLYDSALLAGVEEQDKEYADKFEDEDDYIFVDKEPEADEVDPNKVYKDANTGDPIKPDPTEEASVPKQESELDEESIEPTLCRSNRNAAPLERLEPRLTGQTYNQVETEPEPKPNMEYDLAEAKVLAMIMCQFNDRLTRSEKIVYGRQYIVTYSLKKGIQNFRQCSQDSAFKEMKWLNDRTCFNPIHKSTMHETKCKRALESLIFLPRRKMGQSRPATMPMGAHNKTTFKLKKNKSRNTPFSTPCTMLFSVLFSTLR